MTSLTLIPDTSHTLCGSDISATFLAPFASQKDWGANVRTLCCLAPDLPSELYRDGDFLETLRYKVDPAALGTCA